MKGNKFFFIATAMAIFVLASLLVVPGAFAQGPDEFTLNVTLPKGGTYTYPMLSNENLSVKPKGADVILLLTSAQGFNVYDGKGNPVPVKVIVDKGATKYVSAIEFKDGTEGTYVLDGGAEGLIFDISAEFTAPKATVDVTFTYRIAFNKPVAKPTPAPTVSPATAQLTWVSNPVTLGKDEAKIATLKSGEKGALSYTTDMTVTVKLSSTAPFVLNKTLLNVKDAKSGLYTSAPITYTKASQPEIAVDLATAPVDVLAASNLDKAEARWMVSSDQKLGSGQNITVTAPASPAAPAPTGKKADVAPSATGLPPMTGYGDPSSNFLLDLWNAFLSFIGLRPTLAPAF